MSPQRCSPLPSGGRSETRPTTCQSSLCVWGGAGWGACGGVFGAGPLVFAESLPTQVKFGSREWVLGRVEYDTRASDVPLSLILPLVIGPMVAIIAVSVYCYW